MTRIEKQKLLDEIVDQEVLRRLQREERRRTPEERKRRNGGTSKLKLKLGLTK